MVHILPSPRLCSCILHRVRGNRPSVDRIEFRMHDEGRENVYANSSCSCFCYGIIVNERPCRTANIKVLHFLPIFSFDNRNLWNITSRLVILFFRNTRRARIHFLSRFQAPYVRCWRIMFGRTERLKDLFREMDFLWPHTCVRITGKVSAHGEEKNFS